MSIKSEIEKSVRFSQRGIRINNGDQFWRGYELVYIVDAKDGNVTYRVMSTGDTSSIERKNFVSKGLMRVAKVKDELDPFLNRVWAIVSTKSLPFKYRFDKAKEMIGPSVSRKDRLTAEKWLYALTMQREPKK